MSNTIYKKAYFASGCFWGTEYWLRKEKGTISTQAGYTGGHKEWPTYKEVGTGSTGHAEAVEVVYNPELTTYEKLLKIFFETHNPSQANGQGHDIGTQYRSAIFYQTEEEKETAKKVIQILEDKDITVVTELTPFDKFWTAENYHQDYYSNTDEIPPCHVYEKKF